MSHWECHVFTRIGILEDVCNFLGKLTPAQAQAAKLVAYDSYHWMIFFPVEGEESSSSGS